MRILIIDDLKNKIMWIEELLKEKNIEYEVVSYFNEAYCKILNSSYDGIILDMQFPIYSDSPANDTAGRRVLKRMKHRNLQIPVLGNTTMRNFPTSEEYPFIKGKLSGYRTWDDVNMLIEFLKSIDEQSE